MSEIARATPVELTDAELDAVAAGHTALFQGGLINLSVGDVSITDNNVFIGANVALLSVGPFTQAIFFPGSGGA